MGNPGNGNAYSMVEKLKVIGMAEVNGVLGVETRERGQDRSSPW